MRLARVSTPRITLGVGLLLAAAIISTLRPGIALAHHVDLAYVTTCDSYTVEADYIGGDEARYANVYVDGVLVQTTNFPAGTELSDNFFTLTGALPVDTTIEVRMYRPQPGPDALEDIDAITVSAAMTCTATGTPQPTMTPSVTREPATETVTATVTATSTSTQAPSATPTVGTQGSVTPLPTDTPSPSGTPTASLSTSSATPERATSTPAITRTPRDAGGPASTPTLVTTVEALHPPAGPDGPETGDEPPLETASGLPSTGAGAHGLRGVASGLVAAILAGIGLAVTATGVRRVTD